MKIVINESQLKYLIENYQLADKLYFKTNKLSEEDKNNIIKITNSDELTTIISSIYLYNKETQWFSRLLRDLPIIYQSLKTYNKNVLPIKNYDINKPIPLDYKGLMSRIKCVNKLKTLPSIAIRNLKDDIRKPRELYEFYDLDDTIDIILAYIGYIDNKDENRKIKILNKLFNKNTTFENILKFTDEKSNFVDDTEITKNEIMSIVNENDELEVVYENEDTIVIRVTSVDAIKSIGCNSLWCFTYGEYNWRDWQNNSYNRTVYVVINFNLTSDNEEFMLVLTKPLGNEKDYEENDSFTPLFNMHNDNIPNPYNVLRYYLKTDDIENIFTFYN